MARLPEPGTPEHEERMQQVRQRLQNGPRLRVRILVYSFVVVTMVLPAIYFIVRACSANAIPAERLGGAVFGSLLLLLPARVMFVVVRRRIRTGAWSMRPTPEERITLAHRWSGSTERLETLWVTLDIVWIAIFSVILWLYLGPHHGPLDGWDAVNLAVAVAMILSNSRSLWRRWKKRSLAA